MQIPGPRGDVARFIISFGFGKNLSIDAFNEIIVPAFKDDPENYKFPWPTTKINPNSSKEIKPLEGGNPMLDSKCLMAIDTEFYPINGAKSDGMSEKSVRLQDNNGKNENTKKLNGSLACNPKFQLEKIDAIVPSLFPIDTVILAKCLVFNFYILTYPDVSEGKDTLKSRILKTRRTDSFNNEETNHSSSEKLDKPLNSEEDKIIEDAVTSQSSFTKDDESDTPANEEDGNSEASELHKSSDSLQDTVELPSGTNRLCVS